MPPKSAAILLGTVSSTANQTLSWIAEAFPPLQYNGMNVLVSISTFSSGWAAFSFQEEFGGAGFVETATTGSLSATGSFWLSSSSAAGSTTPLYIKAQSPILGTGGRKQCVVTTAGSVASLNATVYMIPTNT